MQLPPGTPARSITATRSTRETWPVRPGTSWSAARSTWSARSSPSGTSPQEPHAQVHAARDHRQQEGKSEAGPQASTTYREAAEQDQGERYSSGAEKDVPRRARTRDFTSSLAGGRAPSRHVRGGGLRFSPPYGQPVDQQADAGESAKQRDDLGDQAFSAASSARPRPGTRSTSRSRTAPATSEIRRIQCAVESRLLRSRRMPRSQRS